MGPDTADLLTPSTFDVLFNVVLGLVVIVFLVAIVLAVVRFGAARKAGLDPLNHDLQVLGQLKDSALLAPAADGVGAEGAATARPAAERLAEADALLRAGTITADEHARVRARILDEV